MSKTDKVIDNVDKSIDKDEEPVTKAIPYFAVTIFIGLVLVVAYDYFMVIR